jgi:hypothetical protein
MQASVGGQVEELDHGTSGNTLSKRRRLTVHGLAKILNLAKKELLGIPSQRSFGKSDVDLGSHYLQLMLRTFKLITQ